LKEDQVWSQVQEELRFQLAKRTYDMWLKNTSVLSADNNTYRIGVPSKLAKDWLADRFSGLIQETLQAVTGSDVDIDFVISPSGHRPSVATVEVDNLSPAQENGHDKEDDSFPDAPPIPPSELNVRFKFSSFVVGHNSQFAHAAAKAVAEAPGDSYNPLFLYGGVGLGKTHLMHAGANRIKEKNSEARLAYVHSERFVGDMVKALQHNTINDFQTAYRSLDALMIDDIQFFAGKERSQEEFFHTFNALLEGQQQVIVTADRYPKEVSGLEERLKSRFGWGLTVAIEPPELETCVAILIGKAQAANVVLPEEVAFFIAKRIRSNVRELEGALKRVIANSRFTGKAITLDFTKEALRDLLTLQAKLITIENIQKTVADYYKVRVADLLSKRRSRSIARPRQVAMALAKELTTHSLPEIGDAFGGRDHTTVLHACGRIRELRVSEQRVGEDYQNLLRTLTG